MKLAPKLPLTGEVLCVCVPCLSALSVASRLDERGVCRESERNGDFCDEIGVPGEHCLGQETAAITGERKEGGQEETASERHSRQMSDQEKALSQSFLNSCFVCPLHV